ncbi:unnamed protein product [Protopolystoma xenopodis]|uniref:Uncharacterized protein n=1 Tax=Protopolystoma xenopodis TaxID=117903 RepID=A0A448XCI1_9PLAT|nr:unnamed protein product [Protopolystoma xenopodis]
MITFSTPEEQSRRRGRQSISLPVITPIVKSRLEDWQAVCLPTEAIRPLANRWSARLSVDACSNIQRFLALDKQKRRPKQDAKRLEGLSGEGDLAVSRRFFQGSTEVDLLPDGESPTPVCSPNRFKDSNQAFRSLIPSSIADTWPTNQQSGQPGEIF